MTQMNEFFYQGYIVSCFEEAKKMLAVEPDHEQAKMFVQIGEKFNIAEIPTPVATPLAQQEERADENYAAMDEVLAIREIKDEAEFQARIRQLEETAKTGSLEEKAQSFFTQGQLFLYSHHYEESAYCFTQAVKCQPKLAVYYGIAAQTMMRLDYSPFEVLGYLQYALQLDSNNARWHWNRALILTQLYKDLQDQMFLENALIALETAQQSLRPDQKSLAQAIENTFETMKDHLFN